MVEGDIFEFYVPQEIGYKDNELPHIPGEHIFKLQKHSYSKVFSLVSNI